LTIGMVDEDVATCGQRGDGSMLASNVRLLLRADSMGCAVRGKRRASLRLSRLTALLSRFVAERHHSKQGLR